MDGYRYVVNYREMKIKIIKINAVYYPFLLINMIQCLIQYNKKCYLN